MNSSKYDWLSCGDAMMGIRTLAFLAFSTLYAWSSLAGEPVPMIGVNSEWIEKDPWLSPDRYTLLFSSNRNGGDFDIFQTRWDGHNWSPPVRLSSLINSDFDETQPSLSDDGHFLLFISFRGRFVRGPWISHRQPDGSWGTPRLVVGHSEPEISEAILGPDGKSIFFTSRSKSTPGKKYDMCMRYDSAQRFWGDPYVHGSEPPTNEVMGDRWRFTASDGDLYFETIGNQTADQAAEMETLNAVDCSSTYGRDVEDCWVSEAQNLVDGLEDTSWISGKGVRVEEQWVRFALNGFVRYVPGLSRIHTVRIHTGPVQSVKIEKRHKKKPGEFYVEKVIPAEDPAGTQPTEIRILGGMEVDSLQELAHTTLDPSRTAPWHDICLERPTYLRYLQVEVLASSDSQAPFVAFNEVQALGAGLSAPRVTHRISKDKNCNVTVDGKPFFPVYIYYAHASQELADWGFTTTLETYDLAPDSSRLAVLDRAADLGLKVIGHVPWVDTEAERKRARNQILAARHHPALLGYLLSDESGHSEAIMARDEQRANFIRRYDPFHFTMLNDLYPQNYPRSSRFVDFFSIDPYPHIVGQPYRYQATAVDLARQSVDDQKPVFVVNASWGPIVSPVENRLNVYLALIHGAKGISWYEVGVRKQYPDHWASILRCVREINRLNPVLFAPPPPPDSPLVTHSTIENPGARIDTMIRAVNDEVWLLAANCEPRPAHVRFSFGWAEAISIREVMADHPQAWSRERSDFTPQDGWPPPKDHEPIRNARPIELLFPPHGVRVFRMRPSGSIGPHHLPSSDGQPMSMVNESFQRNVIQQIAKLRDAGKHDEAKVAMNEFWSRYGDRLAAADLAALMDEMRDEATVEEILAGYGRLAEQYPKAKQWPSWVFTIVEHLVKAGRQESARSWLARLVQELPDSLWRANAEALVDPASARSGRKPWIVASRLNNPPVIDGMLSKSEWQQRVSFKNTVFLDASKHPQPTEFAVGYDDESLYLAVKLVEPAVNAMKTRVDKDDGPVWSDDSIVAYFDPMLDYNRYAQFIFNSAGTMWDGWGDRRGTEGPGSLSTSVERKTQVIEDAWQIEFRLPFDELGVSCPASGDVWGLGLQRWRHVEGALFTVWGNREGTSLDNRAETFGFLVFQ
jgi:hypothetical protein